MNRRVGTVNRKKRIVQAPRVSEESSDEEFELEKRKYSKRSNVKRPIEQGMKQLSRKRRCCIVCITNKL